MQHDSSALLALLYLRYYSVGMYPFLSSASPTSPFTATLLARWKGFLQQIKQFADFL